jgi:triosephosphate isomerase (TIM)
MRKKIIAGNWKMNLTKNEAMHLFGELELSVDNLAHSEVFVFAPFVYLDALNTARNADGMLHLGAQNFYPAHSGAFTGEIALSHLKDLGVNTVLIGHSERRMLFHETEDFIKDKIDAAILNRFTVFFCCGEPEDIRDAGQHFDYVEKQLRGSLLHLNASSFGQVVISYEPIWAIGTGKTASNEQANEMHKHIRSLLKANYGEHIAEQTRIIYGGSCNANNSAGLFSMSDIDGGLIGGASLKASDFLSIINSAR